MDAPDLNLCDARRALRRRAWLRLIGRRTGRRGRRGALHGHVLLLRGLCLAGSLAMGHTSRDLNLHDGLAGIGGRTPGCRWWIIARRRRRSLIGRRGRRSLICRPGIRPRARCRTRRAWRRDRHGIRRNRLGACGTRRGDCRGARGDRRGRGRDRRGTCRDRRGIRTGRRRHVSASLADGGECQHQRDQDQGGFEVSRARHRIDASGGRPRPGPCVRGRPGRRPRISCSSGSALRSARCRPRFRRHCARRLWPSGWRCWRRRRCCNRRCSPTR